MKDGVVEPKQIIYRDGKPSAVIVPIEEYEELLERLEDQVDLAYLRDLKAKGESYQTLENLRADFQ